MQTIDSISALRTLIKEWKQAGLRVGFVPTMGNLHAGHLSLVKRAFELCDKVVVSIFVNPLQFNNSADLANYPKTIDQDIAALISHKVDALYLPTPEQIYPKGLEAQTFVEVPVVSEGLCGADRPGHFRGVSTIVTKLFNIVQPDVACFGSKDYQQLQVIKTMVEDLSMPIHIESVATMREADGLAMSSRNNHLTESERCIAPKLKQIMDNSSANLALGQPLEPICQLAIKQLTEAGFKVDYFEFRCPKTLKLLQVSQQDMQLFAAAYLGIPRLIDNISVRLQK